MIRFCDRCGQGVHAGAEEAEVLCPGCRHGEGRGLGPDGSGRRDADPPPAPCHVCGAPSSILCDHPVERPTGLLDGSTEPGTCDRPLCDRHAVNAGRMHILYTTPRGFRRGRWETVDYCPEHAAAKAEAAAERAAGASGARVR